MQLVSDSKLRAVKRQNTLEVCIIRAENVCVCLCVFVCVCAQVCVCITSITCDKYNLIQGSNLQPRP